MYCWGISLVFLINEGASANSRGFTSIRLSRHSRSIKNNSTIIPSLVITSAAFHGENDPYPKWFNYTFGSEAVFYSEVQLKRYSKKTYTSSEFEEVRKLFLEEFPTKIKTPNCSISMLGFIENYNDKKGLQRFKHQQLDGNDSFRSSGNASLNLQYMHSEGYSNTSLECFYRDLWKYGTTVFELFYFCPLYDEQICQSIDKDIVQDSFTMKSILSTNNVYGHLTVPLANDPSVVFETTFNASFFRHSFQGNASKVSFNNHQIGICSLKPYITSIESKESVNLAIMHEWMKYHLKLGYKVMVFDRYGFYRRLAGQTAPRFKEILRHSELHYHSHTVFGLLGFQPNSGRFDNSEIHDKDKVLALTNDDKTMTFTHCRQEFAAIWGIETVVICDFDEFLFCFLPGNSNVTADSQRKVLEDKFNSLRESEYLSASYDQMVTSNTTALLPTPCILDAFKRNPHNGSVFSCYGPTSSLITGHSQKSINLFMRHPQTDYHQTCGNQVDHHTRNSVDCSYHKRYAAGKECKFIHLSTNENDFIGSDVRRISDSVTLNLLKDVRNNELWKVSYS